MFLKCLELYGFKTFADRVRIDFAEGITALLGPNGCGKSNVVDAVKWVLGEQSLKNLRAEKSEDLIFAGTDTRSSMNVAEVILTICNEEGLLALETDEIQIKRRLFRSGENEYYINNIQVRLKDLKELFWDTGVGKIAYSIMEQGKIDQVLSSRPEDRRYLFEEAAQITRAKMRVAEGDRRLVQIHEDLEKVDVQLNEVTRRADALRDQAEDTQKYRELKDEVFALERDVYLLRLKGYVRDRDRLEADLKGAAAKRDSLLAEIEAINTEIAASMDGVNDLQKELLELDHSIFDLGRTKNIKADQTKQLTSQKNELRTRLGNLEIKKASLEEGVAGLQEDIGEKEAELFAKRRSLEDAKKNVTSFEENIRLAENQITVNSRGAEEKEAAIKEKDAERGALRKDMEGLTGAIVSELDKRLKDAGYSTAHYAQAREAVMLLVGRLKALTSRGGHLFNDLSGAIKSGSASGENLEKYSEALRSAFAEAGRVTGDLEKAIAEYTELTPAFLDEFLSPQGIITQKRELDEKTQANLAQVALLKTGIEGLLAENGVLAKKTEEYRETLSGLKVTKAQNEAQIQGVEDQVKLLRRNLMTQETLLRENHEETATEKSRMDKIQEEILELDGEISSIDHQGAALLDKKAVMEQEINRRSSTLTGNKETLDTKQQQASRYQRDLEQAAISMATSESNIVHVKESFQESYSLDLLDFEERMYTITSETSELREEVQAKKQALKELGNVNLMAPEEYQGEEDRRLLLVAQKTDVMKALEDLKRVNEEIQAEASEQFLVTYNKIKKNFHNMFRQLFGGGQAQLRLVDGTNVLQSGIEIIAQPPGKKLENIALLSGGEKTMTAVALLFATYQVRPSPFCLLDEIDAALDAPNVGRFVGILNAFSEKSQFLVITHNNRTAVGARTLFGITMGELGVSSKFDVRMDERGDANFTSAETIPLEEEDIPPEEGIVLPPHPPRRIKEAANASA